MSAPRFRSLVLVTAFAMLGVGCASPGSRANAHSAAMEGARTGSVVDVAEHRSAPTVPDSRVPPTPSEPPRTPGADADTPAVGKGPTAPRPRVVWVAPGGAPLPSIVGGAEHPAVASLAAAVALVEAARAAGSTEPWRSRFPTLVTYLTDRFGRPVGSVIVDNVLVATPLGRIDDTECVRVEGTRRPAVDEAHASALCDELAREARDGVAEYDGVRVGPVGPAASE
ncbi:MAG: hypothetical protein ACKO3W_07690 [bacterium]